MSVVLTAIFIEPAGSLLTGVKERKAWLENAMPGQRYTCHPPHSTLLFGDYGPPMKWMDRLRERMAVFPAFTLATDSWQEFPNDLQAAGGHTIGYRVKVSPELLALQLAVAETLAPYREPLATPHPFADREPFATSLRRFGFPFVGNHWVPHFTIGSPRVPDGDALVSLLMSGSPVHESPVRSVSLWHVSADHHERLSELALAEAAS